MTETVDLAMEATSNQDDPSEWRIPQCAFVIQFPNTLLERIRTEVEEARTSARGAYEIGGLLFGLKEPTRNLILESRPLPCEHAMGPGFVLSDRDEAALAQILAASGSDPALSGLELLGWYHSHIKSRMFLSELDRQVHSRYFAGLRQIALVLRPAQEGVIRAGCFFREPSGQMRTDSPYQEVTIEPRAPRKGTSNPQCGPASKSEPKPPLCPRCGGQHVRRSRRTGLSETIRGLIGFYPYRCRECLSRSFIKSSGLPDGTRARSRKRPEETRRSRVRTRREILLWGGGILGFLAILAYLIRDAASGTEQP